MNLRSIGILSVALTGAIAVGACTNTSNDLNTAGALDNTKVARLPNDKAPSTLASKAGPTHPNSPPLSGTKADRMLYGAPNWTLPNHRAMTGQEIRVAFRGRRTVFVTPKSSGDLTFRDRVIVYNKGTGQPITGNWRVRSNLMCIRWPNKPESCYSVYAAGRNRYTVWSGTEARGRITVR